MSTRQLLGQYRGFVECPVCNVTFPTENFVEHTLSEHPYFFVVWASMNMPSMLTPSLEDDDLDEEMSYEYLSALCEMIGNHKVGVTDVNTVAPIATEVDNEGVCVVCMEELQSVKPCRKINKCNHVFCSSCIEKWFQENKTCPVCMQHVD
jgi:hypothetical protein